MHKPLYTPRLEAIRDADLGYGLACVFWAKPPLWELQEWYMFALRGVTPVQYFLIPRKYQTDKASIPTIFAGWPLNYTPDGLCTVPALEHDFLCDLWHGGSEWLESALCVCPHCRQTENHTTGCEYSMVPIGMPEAPKAHQIHEHFRLRLHEWGVRYAKAELYGKGVAMFGPGGAYRPSTIWRSIMMLDEK